MRCDEHFEGIMKFFLIKHICTTLIWGKMAASDITENVHPLHFSCCTLNSSTYFRRSVPLSATLCKNGTNISAVLVV
jgi:hypothetical protein